MMCCTVVSWSRTRASNGAMDASMMMTRSSAWLMTYASCSGNRRMLSVCNTAPMHGMARYASMWVWLFHMNVPTRSPGCTPKRASAEASRSARSATCANVLSTYAPPASSAAPVNVMILLLACTCRPYRKTGSNVSW